MSDIRSLHESNRAAWNEAAARYAAEVEEDIAFLRAGGKNLMAPELRFLRDLDAWCGRAIHLQCAGGRDTLSLWNHGAAEVVGVDISEAMIACARRKSAALNAPARWYRCDVLETPHELNGTADLVYTGKGALCWLMDLEAWASVVFRLLRPGGYFYLFEGHPLTWVWDCTATEPRLDPEYGDYFTTQTYDGQGWPDEYIGDLGRPKEELARKYERQWPLFQVINTLLQAGLCLERLEEHPEPFWEQFPHMPQQTLRRLPNTYSLWMRRPPA